MAKPDGSRSNNPTLELYAKVTINRYKLLHIKTTIWLKFLVVTQCHLKRTKPNKAMTSKKPGKITTRVSAKRVLSVVVGMVCATCTWAQDADILMLVGPGEVRGAEASVWTPARVTQKLSSGSTVRTGPDGQMALLLRDQTQLRLNQNTTLQIRSLQAGSDATVLSLTQGRLWAQVKQFATGALRVTAAAVSPNRVRIITPTATVGIRGTDWELVVGDQGITTLTVVSGEVEMSNEFGQVSVGANEQAVAEAGKAPVKSLLSSARDRVQWVTAYRPSPARWVPSPPAALQAVVRDIEAGAYSKAVATLEPDRAAPARLLLADVYIYLGRTDDAIKVLAPLSQAGRGDPVATALQGRALLIAGRLDEAASLLQEGLKAHPAGRELVLAAADVARVQGNADEALRWFSQVTLGHPKSHEAWFGVGRIQVDKEDVRQAKTALDEALRLSPTEAGYLGERATLLALSGDLKAARLAFDEALKQQPDDYLAWTGLGILQLKTGEPQQALESFLKATVLEPRFARAQLYAGVAYYQLGQLGGKQRAIEAVNRAAQLDAKDPLPYLMLGLIYGDAQELALATEAAQQAQVRMPFLKSANQLLNNQKGSANAGSALANRGMEEWARSYAAETYSPYWAGGAFFLADRYTNGFNKNSQLYRGFLLDPLSFGASNRFSSLVTVPGHYGSLGIELARADIGYTAGQVTANGLFSSTIPIAYSITGQKATLSFSTIPTRDSSLENLTVGLGIKPLSELGVFYFGSRLGLGAKILSSAGANAAEPSVGTINVNTPRHDIGLSYRFAPENQILVKYGQGQQSSAAMIKANNGPVANDLGIIYFRVDPDAVPVNPIADRVYRARNSEKDFQLSHSFAVNKEAQITWGYESAKDKQSASVSDRFQGARGSNRQALYSVSGLRELKYSSWHLSARYKSTDVFTWQADLAHQKVSSKLNGREALDIGGGIKADTEIINSSYTFSGFNPRLGLRIITAPGQQLRLVYQRWRRPPGVATLGPVDTLGIPVDDRLVKAGGQLSKLRAQFDWQRDSSSFYQFFAEQRRVVNLEDELGEINTPRDLATLDSVRPRIATFGQAFDELEETPLFTRGKVTSVGVVGNWILASDLSMSLRYHHANSHNTGASLQGLKIPYIPRHLANVLIYWQPAKSWQLIARATYRSSRFTDEANLLRLASGWNYGFAANWESADKRLNFQVLLLNLRSNKQSTPDLRTELSLSGIYRF
jgi:Flp pilus assembly protein TadD